jgi:UDP-N-acetylglucosamine 2-epimerase (non-hydrolysing)
VNVTAVVGARPNFMKAWPVVSALEERGVRVTFVHTGQHYDDRMAGAFFRELGMRAPDEDLGVGSGSHAWQTGEVMRRFDAVLEQRASDLVLVFGDVNSTAACALTAVKRHVPVAHVESGLRSGDRRMPEEINRLVTDAISALCFVTEPSGVRNLRAEGVPDSRVHHVGNTMIDSLLKYRDEALSHPLPAGVPERFGTVTLHRPSNVDDRATLEGIVGVLTEIARELPLVWPLHPRTEARLEDFGMLERVRASATIHVTPPAGYLDFLGLTARAALILTDSGGIQEEALVLGVPVVTLRESTERPVTVECGGNVLAGADPARIREAAAQMLGRSRDDFCVPELWDGRAGTRIADTIVRSLEAGLAL